MFFAQKNNKKFISELPKYPVRPTCIYNEAPKMSSISGACFWCMLSLFTGIPATLNF